MLGVHIEKEVEMYHRLASFRALSFRYMNLVCIPVFGWYYNIKAPACQDAGLGVQSGSSGVRLL